MFKYMIELLFSIVVTSIHSEIANIGKDKQKKSKSNINYFILNNPKLENHILLSLSCIYHGTKY